MALEEIKLLRDEGMGIQKKADDMLKKAYAEKRSLTKEENTEWEKLMSRSDEIKAEIEKRQKFNERNKFFEDLENTPETPPVGPEAGKEEQRNNPEKPTPKDEQIIKDFRAALRGVPISNLSKEFRAMQADSLTGGGFLIIPEKMSTELLKDVDSRMVMRQICSKETVTDATSLGIPTIASDPSDPVWTTELAETQLTAMTFGKRELSPHPVKKGVLVSEKLIRASSKNVDQIIRERLAYKFDKVLDYAYMQGDGNKKPLGIFTASNDGISTSRDSTTTSSTLVANDLIEAKYTLNAQYWNTASWVMGQDMMKAIRKLQDGAGNNAMGMLLSRDFTSNDLLLGRPIIISDHCPTYSAGNYVSVFGDFKYYQIVDALTIRIKLLLEKYSLTNQIAYIADLESDGMPVLENAFVRVKLHS